MRERLEAKLILLKTQRDQLMRNLYQHEGAIAVLEELLAPVVESAPPKESP